MIRRCFAVMLAGLRMGPAAAGVLVLLLFAVPVASQQKAPRVAVDNLLGVSIGSNAATVRAKLGRIGTGDGRDTREGGRKEVWTLRESEFATVAFRSGEDQKIVWVTAFVRPGKEVSFAQLGDLAKASSATKSQVIWNVLTAEGGYRLVAKGIDGKATVIYLLSLEEEE